MCLHTYRYTVLIFSNILVFFPNNMVNLLISKSDNNLSPMYCLEVASNQNCILNNNQELSTLIAKAH